MFGLPLDGVLVVVDAEQIRAQALNKYVGDTVLRQLGQADLMLLNKTDLAPDLAAVRSWLQEHGGRAPVFETIRCDVPLAILVGRNAGLPVRAPATRFEASDPAHDLVYRTWTLSRAAPIARAQLNAGRAAWAAESSAPRASCASPRRPRAATSSSSSAAAGPSKTPAHGTTPTAEAGSSASGRLATTRPLLQPAIPTVDLMVGYHKANTLSLIPGTILSRLD